MPADGNALHIPLAFQHVDAILFHRLDAVTLGVVDCPHSTPKLTTIGPVVVRTQDIITGVLRLEDAARVSEDTYRERVGKAEPSYGDLLYSREGTYFGIAAAVPKGVRVCLGQRMVLIRPDPARLDHRYLKYWLNCPQIAAYILGFRDGSVAERLNLPTIRALPVLVRPLQEQRTIANTLASLDDKIELNRRTSAALERLARAIFRAWFVDFEPVKAKAAGATGFPSMPQEIFDALPSRLVDSEIGVAPEGWEVGKLGDYCQINASSIRKGEVKGEIEYVDISAVSMGRLDGIQRVAFENAPSRARRRIRHGDTIWSCVRPNRRSYLFIHKPPTNRIASTGFAVLSPTGFGASYLYQTTTRPEFVEYLVSNADGSAYPAVRPEHFANAPALVPSKEFRDAFESLTMPMRDLAAALDRESDGLAKARDYLLPKLLSGAVRVRDAERAVK